MAQLIGIKARLISFGSNIQLKMAPPIGMKAYLKT